MTVQRRRRAGFSLPELLIALVIGMVVITAGTDFAVQTFKSRRGWVVREGVDRNARYVGLSLQRDASEAGVAIESSSSFASVQALGDTLSLLSIPWISLGGMAPAEAPVYPLHDDGGAGVAYPPGGNCGPTCLELDVAGQLVNFSYPSLVQLRVGTVRRLLLVTSGGFAVGGTRLRLNFRDVPTFIGRPSGLASLPLLRSGTSVQQVRAVQYWRNAADNTLLRAERFSETGVAQGEPVAAPVTGFTPRLRFTDGGEGATYNGLDADSTNDGNDIIGLRVRVRLEADRTDPAVNSGARLGRWYEWRMSPRNLLYEKNRS
jgi:prepilin-type N-terminal cleavage/methylation domain-containing protein